MKSFKVLFLLAFALLLASPAFALQCKDGNYAGSDECWTEVRISSVETTPVIPGTVLEYDATTDADETNAYIVRVANASADYAAIAGVAQTRIATGDYGRILVRGKGKVRLTAGVNATRDYVYASSTAGALGPIPATNAVPVAFALEPNTSAAATADAYVLVL